MGGTSTQRSNCQGTTPSKTMSAPSIGQESLGTNLPTTVCFLLFHQTWSKLFPGSQDKWLAGKKEGMPCSGREGSKVNSVVYKPPSCGHQQHSHEEKKPKGGEALHMHSMSGSQPQEKESDRERKRPCFLPRSYSNAGRSSVDLEQDRDKVGRLNSLKEAQPKATLQRLESLEIYLNHTVRLCFQRSDFRAPSWLPQVTKEALVSLVKWVQL